MVRNNYTLSLSLSLTLSLSLSFLRAVNNTPLPTGFSMENPGKPGQTKYTFKYWDRI